MITECKLKQNAAVNPEGQDFSFTSFIQKGAALLIHAFNPDHAAHFKVAACFYPNGANDCKICAYTQGMKGIMYGLTTNFILGCLLAVLCFTLFYYKALSNL